MSSLIDKGTIVERIDDLFFDKYGVKANSDLTKFYKEVLKILINEKGQSNWISVKDRRPDTTGIYFVYMPNNAEQQYGTDVYIEPQHTWAFNQTYITHWMLIPILPENEE